MALQVEIRSAFLPPIPVGVGAGGEPHWLVRLFKPEVRANGVLIVAPGGPAPAEWNPILVVALGAGAAIVLYFAWKGLRA